MLVYGSYIQVPNLGRVGPKSGGELVTLFGGYCDDSVSAGIWVIQMGGQTGDTF